MLAQDVDFKRSYKVDGYRGIAFYLTGWAKESKEVEWEILDENGEVEDVQSYTEEVESDRFVIAIMIGDDREHTVDIDDLELLPDGDYCGSCGQIGCGWGDHE